MKYHQAMVTSGSWPHPSTRYCRCRPDGKGKPINKSGGKRPRRRGRRTRARVGGCGSIDTSHTHSAEMAVQVRAQARRVVAAAKPHGAGHHNDERTRKTIVKTLQPVQSRPRRPECPTGQGMSTKGTRARQWAPGTMNTTFPGRRPSAPLQVFPPTLFNPSPATVRGIDKGRRKETGVSA